MTRAAARLRTLLSSDDAITGTEYAILISLVIVAAIGAINLFGHSLARVVANLTDNLHVDSGVSID